VNDEAALAVRFFLVLPVVQHQLGGLTQGHYGFDRDGADGDDDGFGHGCYQNGYCYSIAFESLAAKLSQRQIYPRYRGYLLAQDYRRQV
jgi:hypothetical protein